MTAMKTNILMSNIEKPTQSKYLSSLDSYLSKSTANSHSLIDLPELQIESDSQVEMHKKLEKLQADVGEIKQSLVALHQQQHMDTIKIMTVLDNLSKENKTAIASKEKIGKLSENVEEQDILTKHILPVNDINILKNMDKELSNDNYFSAMVKHFSSFVGTNGQGRGEVLGRKMAEQIMTRELMTKMSWTGVSRTAGCEKKFAFQSLENLVKLFYKVMIKADSRWSYDKNEKLFSGALLKHAKKRALAEKEKLENKKKQRQENALETANNPNSTSVESVTESTQRASVLEIEIASLEFSGVQGGGDSINDNTDPNETADKKRL